MEEATATTKDMEAPPSKRHRGEGSLGDEPNVTIIFCGEGEEEMEIRLHSDFLRRFSQFFDSGLNYKASQQQPKVFRFTSEWCPEQFNWFVSLFEPMAKEKVTRDNLKKTVRWATYLQCEGCLKLCDQVLLDDVRARAGNALSQKRMSVALETLVLCQQSSLPLSEGHSMGLINNILLKNPTAVTLDVLKQLLECVQESKECKKGLWKALTDCLPGSLYTAKTKQDLYESDRFSETILLAFQCRKSTIASKKIAKDWEVASKRTLERIAAARQESCKDQALESLVNVLVNSQYWNNLIARDWLQETFNPRVLVNTSDEEGSEYEEDNVE